MSDELWNATKAPITARGIQSNRREKWGRNAFVKHKRRRKKEKKKKSRCHRNQTAKGSCTRFTLYIFKSREYGKHLAVRQCDISRWLVVNSGSLRDAKSELRGDRFLLDLYSIIISREFIMPVWKPKQHLCKMWMCFPEWNISHFFLPTSFSTCKRIPFFSRIVLSQYMSKYGDRKKKKQRTETLSVLQLLQTFLSMLSGRGNIFAANFEREKEKKSQQHSPWDAGVLLSCCGRVNAKATAPWWSPDRRVMHSHNAASQSNTWWCVATFHSCKLFSHVRHILLLAQWEETFFYFSSVTIGCHITIMGQKTALISLKASCCC